MKEKLERIRELLNELESEADSISLQAADDAFSAFELPQLIYEIVDDLQPLLTPYEAAFFGIPRQFLYSRYS